MLDVEMMLMMNKMVVFHRSRKLRKMWYDGLGNLRNEWKRGCKQPEVKNKTGLFRVHRFAFKWDDYDYNMA